MFTLFSALAVSRCARADDAPIAARPELVVVLPRMPRAVRTERWTKAMRYPGDIDEVGDVPYSLFHKRIGYLKDGDPAIERQSLRFTRDLLADLRDAVRAACGRSRCSDLIQDVSRRAAAYLADRAPHYTREEHNERHNHWNWGWTWQVAGGGATFEAGCTQMRESRTAGCWVAAYVGEDVEVTYYARAFGWFRDEDITIEKRSPGKGDKPLGQIAHTTDGETVWLTIDGLALAPSAAR